MWQTLQTYSGGIIALFTVALVGATVVYIWVTCRLLRQSKNALLADITLRVMGMCQRQIGEVIKGEVKKGEITATIAFIKTWMVSYCETFVKIDKRLGMDIAELFEMFLDTSVKQWSKEKKKLKEKEEKLEKKIKKVKDLERPNNQ